MENKRRVFTVLSIDGGGVRGIVPARILQELEERTGKPVAELFDMIGGTSTGAILVAGLTAPDPDDPKKPRHSAQEMKNFYLRHSSKIFPEIRFKSLRKLSNGSLYDPQPLENILKNSLGDTRMNESLAHIMIAATDIKNFRPVWITHIKGEKDTSPEGWSTMKMRDAVRASTTAPTYFPAKYHETAPHEDMPHVTHRHALIDGGFFGGNAMRRLLTQAKKLAPPDADIVVVHLGTGNVENSLSPEEFNKLGPLGLISKSNGSILLSLVVNMTVLDVANDVREEIGDHFISFDGVIDPEENPDDPAVEMDDASDKNLKTLIGFAEKIMEDNRDNLDRLCTILKHRDQALELHQESLLALQQLTTALEGARTVKSLTRIYRKVLLFSSGLSDDKPEDGDDALKALAQKLSPLHKADLDKIYNVLQDKLENQNQLLNSIKEAGEDLGKLVKKLGDPFRDAADKPGNDNDRPPAKGVEHLPPRKKHHGPPRRP